MFDALSIALALAAAAGLRAFAVIAIVGALGHFEILSLPPEMTVLTTPWVILSASAFAIIEIMADKTPGVDSAWDVLNTFVRIPAGAFLAHGIGGAAMPELSGALLVGGGAVAATTHALKTASRAVINTSPEPISNWLASLIEDLSVVTLLVMIVVLPIVALALTIGLLIIAAWLLPKVARGLRSLWRRLVGTPAESAR
jgi:uncharacterized membrane protein